MKAAGISGNIITYNALISAAARQGVHGVLGGRGIGGAVTGVTRRSRWMGRRLLKGGRQGGREAREMMRWVRSRNRESRVGQLGFSVPKFDGSNGEISVFATLRFKLEEGSSGWVVTGSDERVTQGMWSELLSCGTKWWLRGSPQMSCHTLR